MPRSILQWAPQNVLRLIFGDSMAMKMRLVRLRIDVEAEVLAGPSWSHEDRCIALRQPEADRLCSESPEPTTEAGKDLIPRYQPYFAAVDFRHAAFDFEPPGFFHFGVGWTVEGLDQGKGQLRPFLLGKLSCSLLQFRKGVGHYQGSTVERERAH